MSTSKMNTCSLPYKLFHGFCIPQAANDEHFCRAASYLPQNKDIFVVSYPKCGTTWTQHVVFLLLNGGAPAQNISQVIKSIPFVEQDGFPEDTKILALKYHLPFYLMPFSESSKYIYVARNPKDTCVSYYHFLKVLPGYNIASFDDFFEAFLEGNLPYGNYMDHVNDWHSKRHLDNILFFTYEEMNQNHRDVILRIAKFLDLDIDENIISGVVKHSSFEFMKKHVDGDKYMVEYLRQGTHLCNNDKDSVRKMPSNNTCPTMMRKGIVGDWKNYFSKEQSDRMDAWISRNPALLDLWKDILM